MLAATKRTVAIIRDALRDDQHQGKRDRDRRDKKDKYGSWDCDAPIPGGPVDHRQHAEYLCLIS